MISSHVQKGKVTYNRIWVSITLCISLTLLVASLVYFFYYSQIEKDRVFQSDLNSLNQTSKDIINMSEISQSLSFQIYRNSTVSKLMYYEDPDIYDVTAAISELGSYLISMPYIESIYVYNPSSNKMYIVSYQGQNGVFSKEEITDTSIVGMLENYQSYKPFVPIPRIYSNGAADDEQVKVYTLMCYDTFGWNDSVSSAVIINVKSSWFNKEVESGAAGKAFILDDHDTLIASEDLLPQTLALEEAAWLNNRVKGQESGNFVAVFEGTRSLISYTSPDALGWQYIRVTPYDWITRQSDHIRNTMTLISFIILLTGIIVSWLLSHRIYRPINHLVGEINVLENEKRNSVFSVRQTVLRNLVLGMVSMETAHQQEELRKLGIHFSFDQNYRLALLKIDHYELLKEQKGAPLLPYKFAIMNIAAEVCSQAYRTETIDMNDDEVLILLNVLAEDESEELVESVLRQVRNACMDYLKIGVSLAYTLPDKDTSQMKELYKQTVDAIGHRLFYGLGCVIPAHPSSYRPAGQYCYPSDLEKKLIDAMAAGQMEEAISNFNAIVWSSKEYPYSIVQACLSRLVVTVNGASDQLFVRNGLATEEAPKLDGLHNTRTAEEWECEYAGLASEIQRKLAEKKANRHSDLSQRVNQKLRENYMNPALNLNDIADELHMSSIYVSRLYKQQTMSSIMDVLLDIRMSEACKLLENSDLSISSIAERVGFTSSSYLHRMFKRSFGTTPTEYRRLKREERSMEDEDADYEQEQ